MTEDDKKKEDREPQTPGNSNVKSIGNTSGEVREKQDRRIKEIEKDKNDFLTMETTVLTNFWEVIEGKKLIRTPFTLPEVKIKFETIFKKNIVNLNGILTCVDDDNLWELKDDPEFFAFLQHTLTLNWATGANMPTQKHFFSYMRQFCPKYADICKYPHYPRVTQYLCQNDIEPENNGKLGELLTFFKPATDVDKHLLEAFFITPSWGGKPGTRPGFSIQGVDEDIKGGIGVGKTTVCESLANIFATKMLDFSITDSKSFSMKMLGNQNNSRIIRYDNVKTDKLDSDVIEFMLTSSSFTTDKKWASSVTLQNYYTTVITFNNPSFSEDMAARLINIHLERPSLAERRVFAKELPEFIEANRDAIIADILYRLQNAKGEVDCEWGTRFPAWETEVLLPSCGQAMPEVLKTILTRQGVISESSTAADDIAEIFESNIRDAIRQTRQENGGTNDLENSWKADNEIQFFVPSAILRDWLIRYYGKKFGPKKTAQFTKEHMSDEIMVCNFGDIRGFCINMKGTPSFDTGAYPIYKSKNYEKVDLLSTKIKRQS